MSEGPEMGDSGDDWHTHLDDTMAQIRLTIQREVQEIVGEQESVRNPEFQKQKSEIISSLRTYKSAGTPRSQASPTAHTYTPTHEDRGRGGEGTPSRIGGVHRKTVTPSPKAKVSLQQQTAEMRAELSSLSYRQGEMYRLVAPYQKYVVLGHRSLAVPTDDADYDLVQYWHASDEASVHAETDNLGQRDTPVPSPRSTHERVYNRTSGDIRCELRIVEPSGVSPVHAALHPSAPFHALFSPEAVLQGPHPITSCDAIRSLMHRFDSAMHPVLAARRRRAMKAASAVHESGATAASPKQYNPRGTQLDSPKLTRERERERMEDAMYGGDANTQRCLSLLLSMCPLPPSDGSIREEPDFVVMEETAKDYSCITVPYIQTVPTLSASYDSAMVDGQTLLLPLSVCTGGTEAPNTPSSTRRERGRERVRVWRRGDWTLYAADPDTHIVAVYAGTAPCCLRDLDPRDMGTLEEGQGVASDILASLGIDTQSTKTLVQYPPLVWRLVLHIVPRTHSFPDTQGVFFTLPSVLDTLVRAPDQLSSATLSFPLPPDHSYARFRALTRHVASQSTLVRTVSATVPDSVPLPRRSMSITQALGSSLRDTESPSERMRNTYREREAERGREANLARTAPLGGLSHSSSAPFDSKSTQQLSEGAQELLGKQRERQIRDRKERLWSEAGWREGGGERGRDTQEETGESAPSNATNPAPLSIEVPEGEGEREMPVSRPDSGLHAPSRMTQVDGYARRSTAAYTPPFSPLPHAKPAKQRRSTGHVDNTSSVGGICPAGSYCPAGTESYVQCPKGTYLTSTGAIALGECQSCDAKYYCDETGMDALGDECAAGYYCMGGATTSTPTDGVTGDICPAGSMCEAGSETHTLCLAGTYQASEGQDRCETCVVGFYCPEGSDSFSDKICPPGYYCPEGTVSSDQYECPEGTYSSTSGLTAEEDCLACPAGKYCLGTQQTSYAGTCTQGYYCSGSATRPDPPNEAAGGGICPEGSYCPAGTETHILCPAGKYCGSTGLYDPDTLPDCDAGYICYGGAIVSNPTDGSLGEQCPAGAYCEAGTNSVVLCPEGTLNPNAGGTGEGSCVDCTEGFYCSGTGRSTVSGACQAGYYCPAGQIQANPPAYECDAGYYCEAGVSVQSMCPAGKYQSETGQSDCDTCPAGYYCVEGTEDPVICPAGSYCPAGTESATENQCPAGTFSSTTGLEVLGSCTPCTAGSYCSGTGNSAVTGDCAAGYYCPAGQSEADPAAYECPAGSYCLAGSATPTLCPIGTYRATTGAQMESQCTACDAGHYCDTAGMTAVGPECGAGYYCLGSATTGTPTDGVTGDECPAGSACEAGCEDHVPCLPGYYQSATGQSACTKCPKGYYCLAGSTTYVGSKCDPGHYCPAGSATATENACPAGTYYSTTGNESLDGCIDCPPGKYCEGTGRESLNDNCDQGYYCTLAATVATPLDDDTQGGNICPAGSYCPAGASVATTCPAGKYCPTTGLYDPDTLDTCLAGYICYGGATTDSPDDGGVTGEPCPSGGYCEAGTDTVVLCGEGYYNPNPSGESIAVCLACTEGFYCSGTGRSSVSGACQAGYYCPAGQIQANPPAYRCDAGYYCEAGVSVQSKCPAGTYQGEAGQSDCDTCPAGYYCTEGVEDPVICPAGSYCPAGTESSAENLCPAGTFSSSTGLESVDDCTPCTAGKYCSGGASVVSGDCAAGYYCPAGQSQADPVAYECPAGSYCLAGSDTPTLCPIGTYRATTGAQMESQCTACDAGHYCDTAGMTAVGPDCAAGYYCLGSATTSTPTDGTTGDECPAGSFCEAGFEDHVECVPGEYQPSTGQSECITCPAGYYCVTGSTTYVGSKCDPGHYCPEGSSTATENACPAGTYYTTTGNDSLAHCIDCPPGKYCEGSACLTPTDVCTQGYYCTLAATVSTPLDDDTQGGNICPAGSYCPAGASTATTCPAGKYCPTTGLYDPDTLDDCLAGYICYGGSTTDSPDDGGVTGEPCPSGGYCETGTDTVTLCGEGYLNPNPSGESDIVCLACTEGYYCSGTGRSTVSGACQAGYYCPAGQIQANPPAYKCEAGYYCEAGVSDQSQCPAGEYQGEAGQSDCDTCPAGYYCTEGTEDPVICPAGSYCPAGTEGSEEYLCPAGTFSSSTGLESVDDCTPCTAGSYCSGTGNSAVTGDCAIGYYCPAGQSQADPVAYVCPKGSYCLAGSATHTLCPIGTYRATTGAQMESQCTSCDAGHYCDTSGMTAVGPDCTGGYYCLGGATTGSPTDGTTGDRCGVGMQCPEGSTGEVACDGGSYNPTVGQAECLTCPPGYYCPAGSTTYIGNVCAAGHYCAAGTSAADEFPCPAGTYYSSTGLTSSTGCVDCPKGYYCEAEAQLTHTGECDPGYYCDGASTTATPTGGDGGDICPVGYYCTGTSQPIPAPGGYYVPSTGQSTATDKCSAGYICVSGSSTAQPDGGDDTGEPCPSGGYCPEASAAKTNCPSGTFNSSPGSSLLSECNTCTEGSYCSGTGLSAPSGLCAEGYYCPEGSDRSDPPDTSCPVGNYCEAGAAEPAECPAGTYQDEERQASCKECPEGFYCEKGCDSPVSCVAGSYCPAGTTSSTEFLCPAGTLSLSTGLTSSARCTACPAGSYCATEGLLVVTGACMKGFYCPAGQSEENPAAYKCPAGSYCPAGASTYSLCPIGTFSDEEGGEDLDSCQTCTASHYCASAGLTAPSGDCSAGYYCESGATTSTPMDGTTGDICTVGHYCPAGVFEPVICEPGYFSSSQGRTVCQDCPAGYYCDGLSPETYTPCPQGYYCPSGSDTAHDHPCPAGTYGASTSLVSESQCTPCTAGSYCATEGLLAPTAVCSAGYVCYNGETAAFTEGQECPAGYYCPAGTSVPTACPSGTYKSTTGGMAVTDCVECSAGSYCDLSGLSAVAGDCAAGYYCTGGSSSATPQLVDGANVYGYVCPAGHYCEAGTSEPEPCAEGTYQPRSQKTSCSACPEGYYCDETGMSSSVECPLGYYCPAGSSRSTENPCPIGTLGTSTGLAYVTECDTCPAGSYCATAGLSEATGLCAAGYICEGGSTEADTEQCPAGSYCPEGAAVAIPCPAGSYSSLLGLQAEGECTLCEAGQYCSRTGLTAPEGDCEAGYFCTLGSPSSRPETTVDGYYGPCPGGSYCEAGTINPTLCSVAEYSAEGSYVCNDCTAGYYCGTEGVETPTQCPAGYYCPTGTGNYLDTPCPIGTFSSLPGLYSSTQCSSCTAGKACVETGLTSPSGPCSAGWYCSRGASEYTPDDVSNQNLPCTVGHYCPSGSSEPLPCPSGTINADLYGSSLDSCLPCPGGSYCESTAQTSATGLCSEGYYCPAEESIYSATPTAFRCPAGSYCLAGSETYTECPAGTYQASDASADCDACPEGYYCDVGTETPTDCPIGSYCPAGSSTPTPCEDGTYGILTSVITASGCPNCPPGKYCTGGVVQGDCAGGYWCRSGASTSMPTDGYTGDVCPLGSYCPEGSSSDTPCPDDTWTTFTGASSSDQCGPCAAGFVCTSSSISECPVGYYCPLEENPVACFEQTYNPTAGASSSDACLPCPAGYLCDEEALSDLDGSLCAVGYYCEQGVSDAVPCPGGTYRSSAGAASEGDCSTCRKGTYCTPGSVVETPCDA
eukprot:g894.t1